MDNASICSGGGSSESSQWPFLHSEASPPKRLMSEGDFTGAGSPMSGAMSRLASSQPDPAVVHTRSPMKLCKNQAPVFSFSQPAQPDDMILSTQMNATQMTCSQVHLFQHFCVGEKEKRISLPSELMDVLIHPEWVPEIGEADDKILCQH